MILISALQFQTDREIQNTGGFYREDSTVSTIMHCVLFVVNADMLDDKSDFSTLKNIQHYLTGKKYVSIGIVCLNYSY